MAFRFKWPYMDIIIYCRLVLRTALRHSASMAQAALFIILVAMGAAIWLLPRFGMMVDSSALLAILNNPQFYAILFGSVVCVRLICAPYWVWKDEKDARIKAEEIVNNREKRKNIRIALARYLPEGGRLIELCKNETQPTPDNEIEVWAANIITILENDLDESYVKRFLDGSGMVHYVKIGQRSETHIHREGKVRTGLARLNEFIKELSDQ